MDTTENNHRLLVVCTALFFSLAVLSTILRIWSKAISKQWGFDDCLVIAALLAGAAHVGTEFAAWQRGFWSDAGELIDDGRQSLLKIHFASQVLYVASTGLCRTSVAWLTSFFMLYNKIYLVGISVALTTGSVVLIALRGNVTQPWTTLDGTTPMLARWAAIEVSGLTLDIAIWAFAVYKTFKLEESLGYRLSVIGIFSTRLLLIPILVLRLTHSILPHHTPLWLYSVVFDLATELAILLSLFSANLVCLKPVLERLLEFLDRRRNPIKHTVPPRHFRLRHRPRSESGEQGSRPETRDTDHSRAPIVSFSSDQV